MSNKKALWSIIAITVTVLCSQALALSPLGPPKSRLEQDRWSFAFEYIHSDIDIETSSEYRTETINGMEVPPALKSKYKIENLKSDTFLANIGYGYGNGWDIYAQLGAADAEADITEIQSGGSSGDEYSGFDSDYGLSLGIGTRATFAVDNKLTWGGILQFNWIDPGESDISCEDYPISSGKADLQYWSLQVAAGPTYESDYYRIYGGPFLHYISGDFDLNATVVDGGDTVTVDSSNDIEEDIQIGGYIGAQLRLAQQSNIYTECQFTDDAWSVGFGVTWKF